MFLCMHLAHKKILDDEYFTGWQLAIRKDRKLLNSIVQIIVGWTMKEFSEGSLISPLLLGNDIWISFWEINSSVFFVWLNYHEAGLASFILVTDVRYSTSFRQQKRAAFFAVVDRSSNISRLHWDMTQKIFRIKWSTGSPKDKLFVDHLSFFGPISCSTSTLEWFLCQARSTCQETLTNSLEERFGACCC